MALFHSRRSRPVSLTGAEHWVAAVDALYARSEDMTVGEYELLMHDALHGQRPEHPDLPLFDPPEMDFSDASWT